MSLDTNDTTGRLPEWYGPIFRYVAVVCGTIVLAYNLGSGVTFRGQRISFDREFDHALYRVDDRLAFSLNDKHLTLVRYKLGAIPFRPLCGQYEVDGNVLNSVCFTTADWLYSDYAFRGRPFAFHLKTGEIVSSDRFFDEQPKAVRSATGGIGEMLELQALRQSAVAREYGWTFADEDRLTAAHVAARYKRLSTINESGVVVVAACGLVLLGYLALGLFLFLLPRRRLASPPSAVSAS